VTVSTLVILVVLSVQTASGTVWWAFVRRRRNISALEALGMGLALGTFVSMVCAMTLTGTTLGGVAWALPAIVTAVIAVIARVRGPLHLARLTLPGAQLLAAGVGILAGLALLVGNWARTPLQDPPALTLSDLYFFEAISRGLAEFGPSQSILMTGGSLRYHWFTYAWAGELAQTASAASFVTITRVLPLVTLIGVSLLAAAWAGRLTRVRWVPTLAVLLVVAGGYTGALYGAILNFDSPSQSMTTLWLLALAIAFVCVLDDRTPLVAGLVVVGALSAACTGGKISHAAVAAGGIALVALVGLLTRAPWRRRALLALAVAAVLMLATYLWVLSGVAVDRNLTESLAVKASTWQGLDPGAGTWGVILGTAALLLAVLARLTGLGWLLAVRRTRVQPSTLFAAGAVAVGLAALLLLREGVNELWFVLAASAPAAVVSAAGVGRALQGLAGHPAPLRRPLLWAIVVALPASLASLALSLNWAQHQALLNWLAPISAWLLVPVAAAVVAAWRRPGGRIVMPAVALSVAALALTSIATRPAALWTANRPVTTERGGIAPESGLPLVSAPATPPPDRPADMDALTQQAATWLSQNSSVSDVVVTSYPTSALVPALTGRPMYLAGDVYQVGLGGTDELDTIAERRAVSFGLNDGPDPERTAALCAAGVDWVWFFLNSDGARAYGLPIAYENAAVTILTLPAASCAAG
jgi:hypothetical protein